MATCLARIGSSTPGMDGWWITYKNGTKRWMDKINKQSRADLLVKHVQLLCNCSLQFIKYIRTRVLLLEDDVLNHLTSCAFSWHTVLSSGSVWLTKYLYIFKEKRFVWAAKCQMSRWMRLVLKLKDVWVYLLQVDVRCSGQVTLCKLHGHRHGNWIVPAALLCSGFNIKSLKSGVLDVKRTSLHLHEVQLLLPKYVVSNAQINHFLVKY